MKNPKGELILSAGGRDYRLHLGFSVMASLQTKYHDDTVLAKLDPPPGVANWAPPLKIVVDLFLLSMERHHSDVILEEDGVTFKKSARWLVDDLLSENADALPQLMAAAFPDPAPDTAAVGNGRKPARRA